jgi:hypothetical protein
METKIPKILFSLTYQPYIQHLIIVRLLDIPLLFKKMTKKIIPILYHRNEFKQI